MKELLPFIQLGGFLLVFMGVCVTLATIVFYGGKLTQILYDTRKDVDEVKCELYDEGGIKDKVTRHDHMLAGRG